MKKIRRRHIEEALQAIAEAETIIRLLYLDQHGHIVGRDVAQHSGAVALRCMQKAKQSLGERRCPPVEIKPA